MAWASQPRSFFSCCHGQLGGGVGGRADGQGDAGFHRCAAGGSRLPRWLVFSFWMGSMTMGEIRWMSLEMPPRAFKALSRQAEAGPQQGGGLAGDDAPIRQLDGRGGQAGFLGALRRPAATTGRSWRGDAGLVHQQLQLVHRRRPLSVPWRWPHRACVVAADDLLPGGVAAGLVVHDAVARHVHAHVRGGLVGRRAA